MQKISRRSARLGAANKNMMLGGAVVVLIFAGVLYFRSSAGSAEQSKDAQIAPEAMQWVKCSVCGAEWQVKQSVWKDMLAANGQSSERIKCDKCGKPGVWRQTAFERKGASLSKPPTNEPSNNAAGNQPSAAPVKPKVSQTGAKMIKKKTGPS